LVFSTDPGCFSRPHHPSLQGCREFDSVPAAETDDLDKTVDYQLAYSIIEQVMVAEEPAALIETLAYRAATRLIEELSVLESVSVKVRKRSVPLGGLCDYAEAEHRIEKR